MLRIAGALAVAVSLLVLGLASPASSVIDAPTYDCSKVDCDKIFGDEGTVDGDVVDDEFDDPYATGDDGFGAFFALAAVAVLVGLGITAFKVSTARQLARESGMDPDKATAMTLLSDDGLDATYLAANLRGQGPAVADGATTSPTRTTRERLEELEDLRRQGLVTEDEFVQRRTSILDAI